MVNELFSDILFPNILYKRYLPCHIKLCMQRRVIYKEIRDKMCMTIRDIGKDKKSLPYLSVIGRLVGVVVVVHIEVVGEGEWVVGKMVT